MVEYPFNGKKVLVVFGGPPNPNYRIFVNLTWARLCKADLFSLLLLAVDHLTYIPDSLATGHAAWPLVYRIVTS